MRAILLTLITCLSYTAFSQLTPEQAIKALDSFAFLHPQEKVFVHCDRDMYAAGETIWFKTYITLDGRLTNLSKVVYMELADSKGRLAAKRMLRADEGTAAGEILLSDSLPSGTYTMNAYTLWMLNFPQFIFRKHIAIVNTDAVKKKGTAAKELSFQMLPEGGNLVTGLESRVAFKATDASGLHEKIQGKIIDTKNNTVSTLAALHDGMGVFSFTPRSNEAYMAVVTGSGGRETSYPLPAALPEGIVMTVNNENPNRVFVQLQRSELNKDKYNELLIVAQINHEIIFTGKVDFDAGQAAAAISKKNLPPGILQITTMSMNAVPLAERLVFVNNIEVPAVQLSLDTVSTAKRKKNYYTVDLSGYESISASAAVVNADMTNPVIREENILTSLLLTSDLKGYVHNPDFYFRNKDTSTTRLLDLLMMTQGWRRFKWESVAKYDHPVLKFPFETGISIKGKLTAASGKAIPNGKLELITKAEDSTTILSTATLNANNEFMVYDLNFKKGAVVYYQGTNTNRQQALVNATIYPAFFDSLKTAHGLPPIEIFADGFLSDGYSFADEKIRLDSARGKMLETVTVTGRKRSPIDSLNRLYATEIFLNSDQTLPLDNVHVFDIWQFLQRSVPGITIQNSDTGKKVYFDRYAGVDVFSESGGSTVQFFLNEVPVSVDIIDALHPDDVALVKIFKGNTAIILGADRGAIAVYTHKGRSTRDWRKQGFDFFNLSGYSVTREFYHVNHSMPGGSNSDRRPTLYWNPDLKRNANGKAVISFYNDDAAKKFRVVVQGIDKNGKLLNIERIVE